MLQLSNQECIKLKVKEESHKRVYVICGSYQFIKSQFQIHFFFLPCFVIIVLDPVNTLFTPNSFNIMLINKGFCKDIANLEQERMGSPFLFQDIIFGVHDSWQTGM